MQKKKTLLFCGAGPNYEHKTYDPRSHIYRMRCTFK